MPGAVRPSTDQLQFRVPHAVQWSRTVAHVPVRVDTHAAGTHQRFARLEVIEQHREVVDGPPVVVVEVGHVRCPRGGEADVARSARTAVPGGPRNRTPLSSTPCTMSMAASERWRRAGN